MGASCKNLVIRYFLSSPICINFKIVSIKLKRRQKSGNLGQKNDIINKLGGLGGIKKVNSRIVSLFLDKVNCFFRMETM